MMKAKIAASYLFPNGMVVTFDTNGEQVGELQGEYTPELHLKIFLSSESEVLMHGFPDTIKMLINKKGDSLTENHKTMKSTFLLVAAPRVGSMSNKITLRNVDSGEGLNDFRSGEQNGATQFDVYAADFVPEPGAVYLLALEKYVEPTSATGENGDTSAGSAIAQTTDAVPSAPQSYTFNDQLSVVVENGVATLQIFGQALTAPLDTESEDNTDTEGDAASGVSDSGLQQDNAEINDTNNGPVGDTSLDNGTGVSSQPVDNVVFINANADTNTQDNAGPAAGAEKSENSGPVGDNTDNPTV
jgi:hypothetical protein